MRTCRLTVGVVSLFMAGVIQLVPAGTVFAVTSSKVSANIITCQQWNISGDWVIN
jgi:hypothetical protein